MIWVATADTPPCCREQIADPCSNRVVDLREVLPCDGSMQMKTIPHNRVFSPMTVFVLFWACLALFPLSVVQGQERPGEELDAAIDRELDRVDREENQVRYRGQYQALIPLGHPGAERLLERLLDESRLFDRRQSCANALMDVATAKLIPQVEEALQKDVLMEVWVERELVLLLAKLGQRQRVDRWMIDLQKRADQVPNTATLPAILDALTRLGDLQFRSGLIREASETHQKRIDLLGDIARRVRPELRPGLVDEQWAIHYNLACCFSLLGEAEKGLQALETSLASTTIRLEMALVDGDLKPLREQDGWPAWVERMKAGESGSEDEQKKAAATEEDGGK